MTDIAVGKTVGKVLGADAFSPAPFEPHHPEFFWYGIHGIETLLTAMGTGYPGCRGEHRRYRCRHRRLGRRPNRDFPGDEDGGA